MATATDAALAQIQSVEAIETHDDMAVDSAQLDELAQFKKKYGEEREKRLRSDGTGQYINLATSERFKSIAQDPWIKYGTPINTPVPDGGHCKLLILGAGIQGILQAVRSLQAGTKLEDICIVDIAGGFGGAWYWNRYPGVACHTESYIYMPMLEEMDYMPSKKYCHGEEIRLYYDSIATKFDLHKRAMWQTWSESAVWDADNLRWDIKMTQKPKGSQPVQLTIHSDFIVMAAGLLSVPKLPNLPGIEDFKGHMFHAARWDYSSTGGSPAHQTLWGLADKRVGMIGTGASGVQMLGEVAKYAKEVYLFQRTPARVHGKRNRETDPEEWKTKIASKKGWQKARNQNFNAFVNNFPDKPEVDLVNDSHSQLLTSCATFGTPRHIAMESVPQWIEHLNAMDVTHQKAVHQRIEQTINDPEIAEKLKAWFPIWCKPVVFTDDYIPTFNKPNVKLVDTDGKGIERITERGIVASGEEYPVDILICGTGFQVSFGSPADRVGMTVTGQNSLSMSTKNAQGLTTIHGVTSRGFPNLFWAGPMQSTISPANTYVLDELSTHIAYIISETYKVAGDGVKVAIQPTQAAEDAWASRILAMATTFAAQQGCTPSYANLEGEFDRMKEKMDLEQQMKMARLTMWGRGVDDYLRVLEEWREKGDLEGMELTIAR